MEKIFGLELKDVSSSYTKNDGVLFSINFSFKTGSNEKVLIKGNNGSGKSTLLNIISSNMEYNSGSILFNGEHLNSDDVFSWHILDNFSSNTKIKTIIKLLKKTYPKNKYNKNLYKRFIGINSSKRLNQLSTLEKLRFALLFPLFMDFKIYLIDEPSSFFISSDDIFEYINNLPNKLILVVDHEIEESSYKFDRIITINNGKIISNKECIQTKEDNVCSQNEKITKKNSLIAFWLGLLNVIKANIKRFIFSTISAVLIFVFSLTFLLLAGDNHIVKPFIYLNTNDNIPLSSLNLSYKKEIIAKDNFYFEHISNDIDNVQHYFGVDTNRRIKVEGRIPKNEHEVAISKDLKNRIQIVNGQKMINVSFSSSTSTSSIEYCEVVGYLKNAKNTIYLSTKILDGIWITNCSAYFDENLEPLQCRIVPTSLDYPGIKDYSQNVYTSKALIQAFDKETYDTLKAGTKIKIEDEFTKTTFYINSNEQNIVYEEKQSDIKEKAIISFIDTEYCDLLRKEGINKSDHILFYDDLTKLHEDVKNLREQNFVVRVNESLYTSNSFEYYSISILVLLLLVANLVTLFKYKNAKFENLFLSNKSSKTLHILLSFSLPLIFNLIFLKLALVTYYLPIWLILLLLLPLLELEAIFTLRMVKKNV